MLALITTATTSRSSNNRSIAAEELIIIVNNQAAADSLTDEQLKDIYLGKIKKWEGGTFIYLTVSKENDYNHDFMDSFLNMTPSKFTSHWKHLVFTGQGLEPRKLKSAEELVTFIEKRNGAIGFIPAGVPHEGVKVLNITK